LRFLGKPESTFARAGKLSGVRSNRSSHQSEVLMAPSNLHCLDCLPPRGGRDKIAKCPDTSQFTYTREGSPPLFHGNKGTEATVESPLLQYWSALASIAGFVLGLVSAGAAIWAGCAANKARDAAEQARKEIRRKVFQYSVSSARSLLERLEDSVTRKEFVVAADHARTLANMMDEIANTPESEEESMDVEATIDSGWRNLATESRDWRARFLEIRGRNKGLEKFDEWCGFTSRAATKMNSFLGPVI
jgi:hypothetical protein